MVKGNYLFFFIIFSILLTEETRYITLIQNKLKYF